MTQGKARGVLSEFEAYSTPCVSDALDRFGINGGLEGLLALVAPASCVGPAFTLKFEEVAPGESAPAADYIDEVPAGSVVVVDNGGRTHCTVWGDILTEVAQRRAIAGTVIYGACRDIDRIRELKYPMFALGAYMKSGKNRVRLAATNVPVRIGPTWVRPGDVVCADGSGVVVVPQDQAERVVALAREIDGMEQRVLAAVREGTPLAQARARFNYNAYSLSKAPA